MVAAKSLRDGECFWFCWFGLSGDKAAHVIAQEFGGVKVLPGSGTVKGLLQCVIDAECVVTLVHGVFLFPVM